MRKILPIAAAVWLAGACGEISQVPGLPPDTTVSAGKGEATTSGTPTMITDAAITNALIDLVQSKDTVKIDLTQAAAGNPIGDMLNLGGPIGYTLRNRYLSPGIPLADALERNPDPAFRVKLIELARWERDAETRAAALMAVAQAHDINDFDIFREALIHLDAGVRFGAFEALMVWGHPEKSLPILEAAQDSRNEHEPILRVFAAGGLARLGDPKGLDVLRNFLDDPSWLVRAMAGRYLGDYGQKEDYDNLVGRLGNEQMNNFVLAEFCIAALKLFPKKEAAADAAIEAEKKRRSAPAPPEPAPEASPTGIPDSASIMELEPLVVTTSRVKVEKLPPQAVLDPQINATLLRLLQNNMNNRPDSQAQMDASVGNLAQISTLDGYNLKTRYTQLGFLLTEGLAGTTDYGLQTALENAARQGKNVQIRAAAMVALAYTRDMRYQQLFQSAQIDTNITVRFGALESLLITGDPSVQTLVGNSARTDASQTLQTYAAAGMWKMGDIYGREILRRGIQDPNWLIRAMSTHYIGELGGGDEYRLLMLQLSNETEPMVKAELTGALLKLQKYKDE
jgi:HEAT repeat protein